MIFLIRNIQRSVPVLGESDNEETSEWKTLKFNFQYSVAGAGLVNYVKLHVEYAGLAAQ